MTPLMTSHRASFYPRPWAAGSVWGAPSGEPSGVMLSVLGDPTLSVPVQQGDQVVRRARVSKETAVTVDPLKPVWRKPFPKSKVGGPARCHFARYVPAHEPTWPKPWTVEELAAMGELSERSEAWKKWYAAMPAGMTAKQERAYFLKGNA